MTTQDIITQADLLSPNQYSAEQKTRWLRDLDGRVRREGLGADLWDGDPDSLCIPAPYAADIYTNYLLSRIAEANAEIPKYNLYASLFNSEYDAYARFVSRTRRPKREKGWRY